MLAREDFVGTVLDVGGKDFYLDEFLGEGSTAVVFRIRSVDAPHEPTVVIKLYKPQAFLEMDVLHYTFRVDQQRNPNHPLLLAPEERMRRMTEEMLGRISSSRFEFRVVLYQQIMQSLIAGLAHTFVKPFKEGILPPDFLGSDRVVKLRIDENLLHRIRELLDEDLIEEPYVPFFEHIAEAAEVAIGEWRRVGTYNPLSSNPLYNLLGLRIEDFISVQELEHIAANPRFADRVSPVSLSALWDFATVLHQRAEDLIRIKKKKGDSPSDGDKFESNDGSRESSACVQACWLIEFFASQPRWEDRRLLGLARFWRGKALSLMPGKELQVRPLLESALVDLKATESLGDVHDLLFELAPLVSVDSPEKAEKLVQEAMAIRAQLGLA